GKPPDQPGQVSVQHLMAELRDPTDVNKRRRAAEELKHRGGDAVVEALAARVADEVWQGDLGPTRDSSKVAALAALKALAPRRVVEEALKKANKSTEQR